MKNRILLLICLFGILSTNTFAQEKKKNYGHLYFPKTEIDIGDIKEEDGPVTFHFVTFNMSEHPVVITKVDASCGCTSSNYTKDTIYKYDSAFVDAVYDPMGRPGVFEKGVVVTNDGGPFQFVLIIKGNVIPREKTVADNYPSKFGNLMMDKSYFDYGILHPDEVDTMKAKIYNGSPVTITIKGITGRPDYILTSLSDMVIKPFSEVELTVVLNAKAINDYGDFLFDMELITDNTGVLPITLFTQVHVMERFDNMSKRKAKKAPKVNFDKEIHDFGKILQGDSVVVLYKVTNTGGSPLIIRKLQPACGCTASTVEKQVVEKGETVTIKIVFNTTARAGEDEKTITVITNDPTRPVAKLLLRGEIVTNPNALKDY